MLLRDVVTTRGRVGRCGHECGHRAADTGRTHVFAPPFGPVAGEVDEAILDARCSGSPTDWTVELQAARFRNRAQVEDHRQWLGPVAEQASARSHRAEPKAFVEGNRADLRIDDDPDAPHGA